MERGAGRASTCSRGAGGRLQQRGDPTHACRRNGAAGVRARPGEGYAPGRCRGGCQTLRGMRSRTPGEAGPPMRGAPEMCPEQTDKLKTRWATVPVLRKAKTSLPLPPRPQGAVTVSRGDKLGAGGESP